MAVDVSALEQRVQQWAVETMERVGPMVATRMKDDPQVPRESGELIGAIRSNGVRNVTPVSVTVEIVVPVIQAATTQYGASPHPIVPRRPGGLLVFHWPKAGGTVALRHVNHPGNQPRPWFDPVLRRAYQLALPQAARVAS